MPQDLATGEDGKVKQAKPITLENGEAKVRGIVTYPGGDRVDWKKLELPKDSAGALSLKLSWTAPRPGLVVGVDVFDEYGRPVVSDKARKKSAKLSMRGSRKATIEGAKGTYLIRVYAPFRGDAGAYTLKLAYVQQDAGGVVPELPIPDPPRLAAVPAAAVACDSTNYKTNPACTKYCPVPPDPAWPACIGQCDLAKPDVELPSCQKVMDCPDPPDRRVRKCKGKVRVCGDTETPSTQCLPPPPPGAVKANVVLITKEGTKVRIKLDRGSDRKIDKGWTGKLLGPNGRTVPQSDFVVDKVGKRECYGVVDLTPDQVNAAKRAELSPP